MHEFSVRAEYSVDGSIWRPYRAVMRARAGRRPAAEALTFMIERDILHCLGAPVEFVVVRQVRVHELEPNAVRDAVRDVVRPGPVPQANRICA